MSIVSLVIAPHLNPANSAKSASIDHQIKKEIKVQSMHIQTTKIDKKA